MQRNVAVDAKKVGILDRRFSVEFNQATLQKCHTTFLVILKIKFVVEGNQCIE